MIEFLRTTITLHELAAWISAVLIFASSFRYIHSIIVGKTKPNVVGWLLYQIATICVLVTSYELGSMSTVFASMAYAINQLIIIILAFRYGYARMNRIEGVYFGISMFTLLLWVFFMNSPEWLQERNIAPQYVSVFVLFTNTLIDFMGAVAIFTKLYKHPESEDAWAWFLAFLSGIFSFIAIENFTIHDLIYPIYLITSNLAIWLLCFRKRPRHRFEKFFTIVERIVGRSWRV